MDREKKISQVTLVGALANLLLTAGKIVAGVVAHSAAMLADGIHSLSDLVSDAVVLLFVHLSAKEKDKEHPYGHGKFQTFATLIVAVLLVVVAAELCAGGVEKIVKAFHGEILPMPGRLALWAAAISILVKEAMYQWTARVGKKLDAPVMIANAWHHRSDALSSIGSFMGIGAALLLGSKWAVLDSVTGVAISIFIFVIAVKIGLPAIKELLDVSLPEDVEKEILTIVSSVPDVEDVHELRTRRSGSDYVIDAHIVVRPDMTVLDGHEVCTCIERALRARFGEGTIISLHIEPSIDAE